MMCAKSKQLFLLDGIGALLSAFLLGVVLVQFEAFFGIPKATLYFLAFFPCCFACYDFFCFFKKNLNIAVFLKGIASLNIAYCILSLGLAFYHLTEITLFGWIYIVLEVFVVFFIAILEYRIALTIKKDFKS